MIDYSAGHIHMPSVSDMYGVLVASLQMINTCAALSSRQIMTRRSVVMSFEQCLIADLTQRNGAHNALDYLASEQATIRTLLSTVDEQALQDKIFALPALQEVLEDFLSKPLTEAEKEYAKVFFYQGGYAIIRRWLDQGCPETPTQMTTPLSYISR